MGRIWVSTVVVEVILSASLLGKTFHFDCMYNFLESTAIVEQDYCQQEEAKSIYSAYNPIEGGYPAVFYLFFRITFTREGEGKYSDKVGGIGKNIEDQKERLKKVWLLISVG